MKKSFDTLLQLNDERNENLKINENGHIQVKNLSAYWIPELTAVEVIAGAVYTVTGSYEGTESFLRACLKSFQEKSNKGKGGHLERSMKESLAISP